MTVDDRDYLHRRANAELNMARTATAPEAVRVHYQLASFYLDRLHQVSDRLQARPVHA